MNKKQDFNVVILAAGLSERMGEPKIFLKWDNTTFIENIIKGYKKFECKEIIVVLNERDKEQFDKQNLTSENVKAALNHHVDWGRFYSLRLGLSNLSTINNCFINNIDNPFVDFLVLSDMSTLINKDNYVVPIWNKKKGHPVLISKNIVKDILKETDVSINIKDHLKKFDCVHCEVKSNKILVNINTEEDFQNILRK